MFSYWERDQYFNNIDVCIIGAGIVGLSTAISLQEMAPKLKILVLEKGILPNGASTKNAGFACFGSISEIMADLTHSSQNQVVQLIEDRYIGIQKLLQRLGKNKTQYQKNGGYELFFSKNDYLKYAEQLPFVNELYYKATGVKNMLVEDKEAVLKFGFGKVFSTIKCIEEAQIDTGTTMHQLQILALKKGIKILNSVEVHDINDSDLYLTLKTSLGDIRCRKAIVCTNAFANNLLPQSQANVAPARAQVLITNSIANLKVKGTFHFDEGYFYFRNIHNRILFGGARNHDFETENTQQFELNDKIFEVLEQKLKTHILPKQSYTVYHKWCGIMGLGSNKTPIVKRIDNKVFCAVKMGGMGVALGSKTGHDAAKLIIESW
jgi:gamma-glutamylputrescine oxidase